MHLLFSRNRNDKGNGEKSESSESQKNSDFLEEIPPEVEMRLKGEIQSDEELKVALSTDMTIDGRYGKDWLLATEKRLLTFNQNGRVEPEIFQVLLSEVDELEIRKLFGNNIIKVRTKNKSAEIARFSKSMASKFEPAVSEIQTLIQKSKPDEQAEDKVAGPGKGFSKPKDICSKCGRPFPEWSGGVCLHCV